MIEKIYRFHMVNEFEDTDERLICAENEAQAMEYVLASSSAGALDDSLHDNEVDSYFMMAYDVEEDTTTWNISGFDYVGVLNG